MNLSRIERMAREGDLSREAFLYLVDCRGECEWLDYKEVLSIENDRELCDFSKDALAIRNVGGGYVVVGVKDKTWEPIGLQTKVPYDSKMLRDKLRKCLGLDLEVDIVHHEYPFRGENRALALIHVRASRKRQKRRTPSVVQHDYCVGKPFGVRRGDIYARRGDSTVRVSSQTDLEDLLDRLEEVADRDESSATTPSTPFAIATGLFRILEPGFVHFVGRQPLKQRLLDAILKDPRLWIINVHGPGGVGKSALVNWAVYELYRRDEFDSIIQLTAKESILTERGIVHLSRTLYSLENLLDHILGVFQEEFASLGLREKKSLAVELMCAWKTLLVLDNMETVSDGRILSFVQELPPESKSKVVLTSRAKTGGWELPIPVNEFDLEEMREFIALTAGELQVSVPTDEGTVRQIAQASGRLPLAIKWIMAQYKLLRDLKLVFRAVADKDSPVLEFSFRNIWSLLSPDARTVLATMTIFDAPPSIQLIQIACELGLEVVERGLLELADVTLVTPFTNTSDGTTSFVALPITLSFARHQLGQMGGYEVRARQRVQMYTQQMSLEEAEVRRFRSDFDRYAITSPSERRAVILCKRAESEAFAGREDSAELLLKQAKDLAPQSAYTHAMSASFELRRRRIGDALNAISEACARATQKTGALAYTIKAEIQDAQYDKRGRVESLQKALEYAPNDMVIRHQYGVALSRLGLPQEAVDEFTRIIESESKMRAPTNTLIMALSTRAINLKRLGRGDDANGDLTEAERIIARHPRLQHLANRLKELKEELGS